MLLDQFFEHDSPFSAKRASNDMMMIAPAQRPKRVQAAKACSNCKRLHARCDNERPCKRCSQNGWESSCFDVPRKKRNTKQYQEDHQHDDSCHHPQASSGMNIYGYSSAEQWAASFVKKEISSSLLPFPELKRDMLFNPGSPSSPLLSSSQGHIPLDDDTFLKEVLHAKKQSPSPAPSSEGLPPLSSLVSSYDKSTSVDDIFVPTDCASSTSSEMRDITASPSLPRLDPKKLLSIGRPDSPGLTEITLRQGPHWRSFGPNEFAISVWKGSAPGNTFLIECNEKFIQLTGYAVRELKNNFSCHKLFVSNTEGDGDKSPKKTRISTAHGIKEVEVSICPLPSDNNSPNSPKYFIINMRDGPVISKSARVQ